MEIKKFLDATGLSYLWKKLVSKEEMEVIVEAIDKDMDDSVIDMELTEDNNLSFTKRGGENKEIELPKITGEQGQLVGFDENGEAVAIDNPITNPNLIIGSETFELDIGENDLYTSSPASITLNNVLLRGTFIMCRLPKNENQIAKIDLSKYVSFDNEKTYTFSMYIDSDSPGEITVSCDDSEITIDEGDGQGWVNFTFQGPKIIYLKSSGRYDMFLFSYYGVKLEEGSVATPWVPAVQDTLLDMQGATEEKDGSRGLVPAPVAGDNEKFLRGDGTWAEIIASGGNYNIIATMEDPGAGSELADGTILLVYE